MVLYRVASPQRHSSVQRGGQNDCKRRPLQTLPDVLSWDFSLSGGWGGRPDFSFLLRICRKCSSSQRRQAMNVHVWLRLACSITQRSLAEEAIQGTGSHSSKHLTWHSSRFPLDMRRILLTSIWRNYCQPRDYGDEALGWSAQFPLHA